MAKESYEEHHKRLNRERQRRFREREKRDGPSPVLAEPVHGVVTPGHVIALAEHDRTCQCAVCERVRG